MDNASLPLISLINAFHEKMEEVLTHEQTITLTIESLCTLSSVVTVEHLTNQIRPYGPIEFQQVYLDDSNLLQITFTDQPVSQTEHDAIQLILSIAKRTIKNNRLQKKNNIYEHVIKSTRDGIWDWNVSGETVEYSDQWKSMLGYEPHELENNYATWMSLLHPDDLDMALKKADNFFSFPMDEYNSTFRMRCKDGNYKWILARGRVAEWLDKDLPKRIIGTHVDIDHQKYLEKNLIDATHHLQREKELLTRCSDIADIGTWRVDLTNNTIWWSDKTREIHGVDPSFEPNIDTAIAFYQEGWSQDLITKKFTRCVEHGESYDVELIIITAQGIKKWVRAVGIMSDEPDKKISYGLFQDIDERVQSIMKMEQAKTLAEQANRVKSDFLATMSHEIRTPMNGVLGILQVLQKSDLNDQQSNQLKLALNSADNLLSLINDLLDLSKIEAGKIDLEQKEFCLSELLSDLSQAIAFKAFEKNIDFILDTHDLSVKTAIGDPHRIKQVVTNLLSNAIKFTESGHVSIVASSKLIDKQSVRFSCDVIDSGIGISKQRVNSIFNPFTQEDTSTTRKFGGTGLGLSISRKLCQLMEGDIEVTSEQGHGSRFSFSLNLSLSENYSDVITNELSDHTIQVIGCNDKQYNAIYNMLSHSGATTYTTTTDNARVPTIILLDESILINKNDEHLNSTRDQTATRIMLTSKAESITTEDLHHQKIDRIMMKPFTMEAFLKLLESNVQYQPTVETTPPDVEIPAQTTPSNSAKNILIAEDNFINQQVTEGLLEDYDYQLTIVDNGAIALDTLRSAPTDGQYDLIIMDCQMPEMDGYTATERIRQGEAGDHYQSIPIIAMTANAMKGDREKCLAAGMTDYLTKPIDLEKLISVLDNYLSVKGSTLSDKKDNKP